MAWLDWESEASVVQFSVASGEKKARAGGKVREANPDQLRKLHPPPVDPGVLLLARVYKELATERSIGMVAGPIPVSIIWSWCDRHVPNHPHEAARFRAVMRAVDGLYYQRERARAKTPTPR